jgi:hypothetical protein
MLRCMFSPRVASVPGPVFLAGSRPNRSIYAKLALTLRPESEDAREARQLVIPVDG